MKTAKIKRLVRVYGDPTIWDAQATDRQIYNHEHVCGSCMDQDCHPGVACTPGDLGCQYCPRNVGAGAAGENLAAYERRHHLDDVFTQDGPDLFSVCAPVL